MSDTAIRLAQPADLPAIYELARGTLVHDAFSPALLAEKLFEPRRPEEYTWNVHVAEHAGRTIGFMQSVTRAGAGKGWIGLFAITENARRRGIATALLEHVRQSWPAEIAEVEVLAIPGNYFTPGLDPRYTEALCFLERRGFERFRDCVNLTADLSREFDTSAELRRLADAGVQMRRACKEDGTLLDAFFAEQFGVDWRFEVSLAMRNNPPGLHLALRDERLIAFSAHSSQNREWGFFGPMGTTPVARGLGIGRVLLWHCLNDLRAAGHRTAVIPWVGPIAFYQQWASCRVERVFWRYRMMRGTPDAN